MLSGCLDKVLEANKTGISQEIHMNTISSQLCKVNVLAYETLVKAGKDLNGVKAHQVQAVAASWALHTNAAVGILWLHVLGRAL